MDFKVGHHSTPVIEGNHKATAEFPAAHQPGSSSLWRIVDLSVLAVWVLVTGVTLSHHEKWADEAQSWLLARDLDLRTLWFKELRYEGHPGLWHTMLWLAQHLFHVPYSGLGVIGLLCATGGVALLLLRAPFPHYVRWLLAFSYFVVYQYAVIARPYTLLPLLAFAAAILFKDTKHPERITIVLVLLVNLTLHGLLLAACVGLAYLWQAKRHWSELDDRVRGRYVLCVSGMLLVLLFLAAVLYPPPDVEALNQVQAKTLSVVSLGAWHGIDAAFFDYTPLSIALLALTAWWGFLRREAYGLLLPIMVLVMSAFFGLYGLGQHAGTILIAVFTGLWIAWPTAQEEKTFSVPARWTHRALIVALVCLLGYQTWDAAVAIHNDYLYPYSGSEDAANYLKSVGADHRTIVGYFSLITAVQAYFDHNILVNYPHAYYHFAHTTVKPGEDIETYAPDYVIFPCRNDCDSLANTYYGPRMRSNGYSLVHVSEGYLFFKRNMEKSEGFLIYHRDDR